MDNKKIFNNIQEKIALENFKTERKERKTKRKLILAASFLAVVLAGAITINTISDKLSEEY